MKKVMVLAAMLAMVLAAAVPALAQTQVGQGNVACVQNAANVEIGKVQISQYGDNVNIQQIAQECNITVAEVNTIIAAAGSASATASASAAPSVQYHAAAAQYQYASASAAAEELPSTGGSSLIALGAGVLLVAGGLLARRIVR